MPELMKSRLAQFTGLAWNWTCCSPSQEPTFRALLERLRPARVLEIGTHQGVSAALMAEYAAEVVTVDVLPNPARDQVWRALGVRHKIADYVHKSQAGRDTAIYDGAAVSNLAFIDGSHLMRDVEYDFQLVEMAGCSRIILHDYWQSGEDWPDVKEFADGLMARGCYGERRVNVEIHKPFVYVEILP